MPRHARALILAAVLSAPWLRPVAGQGLPAPSFAPLVRKVVPAVVNIAVTETVPATEAAAQVPAELRGTPFEQQFRRLRNRREQVLGAGSGFIVSPDGVIVTNNHVVGHADRIVVSLSDGTELPARLLGVDDLTDIAVIKVSSATPLPYVAWGDSRRVEVGDWILAAGNPFGLGSSVTAGIVSARGRDIGAGPFDDFIQLDAPINPGNSGGPTFNLEGQVIAVNTAIVSPTGGSVGIGFAIPSEMAARIVRELQQKGRIDRGWLGVSVQDLRQGETRDAAQTGVGPGVGVAGVDRNGPAARAGLHAGDVVLDADGERIDSARSLIRAVAAVNPGASIRLTIRRRAQTIDLPVVVGRRPAGND